VQHRLSGKPCFKIFSMTIYSGGLPAGSGTGYVLILKISSGRSAFPFLSACARKRKKIALTGGRRGSDELSVV
jgi:hypothetical protein